MKYLSSILFICATMVLAYHESLSTVSKHGVVDLLSTWEFHISQFLIVILFTASGTAFGIYSALNLFHRHDSDSSMFRDLGPIVVAGLAPALVIYQFLYPWLCGVVK